MKDKYKTTWRTDVKELGIATIGGVVYGVILYLAS